ncbi:4008_t:CDS:2 [Funneliformis geosporum]|nr:4008_t:CDS:2 [Funneliformis geosporum]
MSTLEEGVSIIESMIFSIIKEETSLEIFVLLFVAEASTVFDLFFCRGRA